MSVPDAFTPRNSAPVIVLSSPRKSVAFSSVRPVVTSEMSVPLTLDPVEVPTTWMPSRYTALAASLPPITTLPSSSPRPPITALVAFISEMPTRLPSNRLFVTVVPVVSPVTYRPEPKLSSPRLSYTARFLALSRYMPWPRPPPMPVVPTIALPWNFEPVRSPVALSPKNTAPSINVSVISMPWASRRITPVWVSKMSVPVTLEPAESPVTRMPSLNSPRTGSPPPMIVFPSSSPSPPNTAFVAFSRNIPIRLSLNRLPCTTVPDVLPVA